MTPWALDSPHDVVKQMLTGLGVFLQRISFQHGINMMFRTRKKLKRLLFMFFLVVLVLSATHSPWFGALESDSKQGTEGS